MKSADQALRAAYLRMRGRELTADVPPAVLAALAAQKGVDLVRGTLHSRLYGERATTHLRGARSVVRDPARLTVGRAVVIGPDVVIECFSRGGVRLGDRVTVARGASLLASGVIREPGEGIEIGDDSAIGAYNIIWGQGGITIGKDCLLAPHVVLVSENHTYDDPDLPIRLQPGRRAPIVIGDDCWLGSGVKVLAGVTIGSGSVVGAGAVVTTSLPERSLAVGVPARVVGTR
ncbi:acyltransferase [Pedococcus bigeumensis]|uniref:acyltransferase n=1 Tax=Pedococcus bigeumensis TaxID=433644 RepID=UPI002FEAD818